MDGLDGLDWMDGWILLRRLVLLEHLAVLIKCAPHHIAGGYLVRTLAGRPFLVVLVHNQILLFQRIGLFRLTSSNYYGCKALVPN